jgi:hypothetical protein
VQIIDVRLPPRPSVRKRERLRSLCEAQNWHCCYCAVVIDNELPPEHPNRATTDHYHATSKGGSDEWENLIAACYACNHARGDLPARWFYHFVRRKGRRVAIRIAKSARGKIDRLSSRDLLRRLDPPVDGNQTAHPRGNAADQIDGVGGVGGGERVVAKPER